MTKSGLFIPLAVLFVGDRAIGPKAPVAYVAPASSSAEPKRDRPAPPPIPTTWQRSGEVVSLGGAFTMQETGPMLWPDEMARPVTILFHAICNDARWTCDWLQYGKMAPQWQICPRAPVACAGWGYGWTAGAAQTLGLVTLGFETLKSRHGPRVRDDGVVLVGLSQGAYAVAAMLPTLARTPNTLRVRGIVLHGAHATLRPADLKALGARVVLAAGEQDGAATFMRAHATELARAGVEARYVSFGDVGHFLPVDSATAMGGMIDWARGE